MSDHMTDKKFRRKQRIGDVAQAASLMSNQVLHLQTDMANALKRIHDLEVCAGALSLQAHAFRCELTVQTVAFKGLLQEMGMSPAAVTELMDGLMVQAKEMQARTLNTPASAESPLPNPPTDATPLEFPRGPDVRVFRP